MFRRRDEDLKDLVRIDESPLSEVVVPERVFTQQHHFRDVWVGQIFEERGVEIVPYLLREQSS